MSTQLFNDLTVNKGIHVPFESSFHKEFDGINLNFPMPPPMLHEVASDMQNMPNTFPSGQGIHLPHISTRIYGGISGDHPAEISS